MDDKKRYIGRIIEHKIPSGVTYVCNISEVKYIKDKRNQNSD